MAGEPRVVRCDAVGSLPTRPIARTPAHVRRTRGDALRPDLVMLAAGAGAPGVVLAIAAILVVGVIAQWVGWRLGVPAIVFLLAAGLVVGPFTGLLDPDELFGDLLFPFVNLAVAVILFEGAMGLGTSRIKEAGRTVWMLLTVGAAITLGLTALAARAVLDVPWSLAWLLSAVLVVTGPTVIGPLVRSIGLRGRVASILEAEGTLIDPIGAILTVVLFQAFYEAGSGWAIPGEIAWTLLVGTVIGLAGAAVLTVALARFLVPDELHNVTTLAMVILAFAAADAIQSEGGLVAVTVMGVALRGQRRVEVHHVLEFNETLRTLFISGLFILLGARIEAETLRTLEWRNLGFLVVLVLAIRPLSVLGSTIRSGLARNERTFLAATAPRGIIAAAIASIFSLRLAEQEAVGSQVLVSATFTVIAGTVLLSGFGSRPLARRLSLIGDDRPPLVILGTNPVAVALAEALDTRGVPAELISLDRKEVSSAKLSGLSARHGSVLDEGLWDQVADSGASTFLALTSNDEANVIACRRVAPLVGSRNVFRVASDRKEHATLMGSASTPGRLLIDGEVTYPVLSERLEAGWRFRATPLTEEFDAEAYRDDRPSDTLPIGVVRRGGLDLAAAGETLPLRPGDVVIALVPDDETDPSPPARQRCADGPPAGRAA